MDVKENGALACLFSNISGLRAQEVGKILCEGEGRLNVCVWGRYCAREGRLNVWGTADTCFLMGGEVVMIGEDIVRGGLIIHYYFLCWGELIAFCARGWGWTFATSWGNGGWWCQCAYYALSGGKRRRPNAAECRVREKLHQSLVREAYALYRTQVDKL